VDKRERIVHEARAGFESLRSDIEGLDNFSGEEFKSGLINVIKNLTLIVERLTVEHRTGQEASTQAFKAITTALKSLSDRLGSEQH